MFLYFWSPPHLLLFPFSLSFYMLRTLVSILQNIPPLSRQFTFKYFNNYFPKKEKYPCIKSSSFDLEEINCWNKNLDVGLDASKRNLDSFLHETCLLAEFNCHLWKIISPSYDIFFGFHLERWYVFESGIHKNWVFINWTSVAQDIQVGMVEGQHWQIARFDFEGCDFHALPYFIFLP